MRYPYVAAAVLAALTAMPVAHAANLSAIYALARANDAQYAVAVDTAAAAREKKAQGLALMLPSAAVTANQRRNWDQSTAYEGSKSYSSSSSSLTLTQPVLREANRATYKQGELQEQLADQQLKLAELDLMMRVSRGYFEMLQAQDAVATVGAQKEAFAQQLAQAKRSFGVGLAPITDVNEAQSRYDLTVAQEIAARNELEVKRRTLEKTIDGPLPPLAVLDLAVNIDILSVEQLQALADGAAQSALQVAIGTTAEEIARFEVRKQNAGHLPTLDVVGNVGNNRNPNFGAFTGQPTRINNSYIGVEFSLPLYQGGGVSSRAREAVANLGRAQNELQNARRQAALDARQAFLGVQSGIALNQALKQALSSSETQVRSTSRGLEIGVRTRVDVLNSVQQLYTTRRDLSAARYQALVSGLQLKSAAGVIAESDLKALDALLNE